MYAHYHSQLQRLQAQIDAISADYPIRAERVTRAVQTFAPTEDIEVQTECLSSHKSSLVDELRQARARLFPREA